MPHRPLRPKNLRSASLAQSSRNPDMLVPSHTREQTLFAPGTESIVFVFACVPMIACPDVFIPGVRQELQNVCQEANAQQLDIEKPSWRDQGARVITQVRCTGCATRGHGGVSGSCGPDCARPLTVPGARGRWHTTHRSKKQILFVTQQQCGWWSDMFASRLALRPVLLAERTFLLSILQLQKLSKNGRGVCAGLCSKLVVARLFFL